MANGNPFYWPSLHVQAMEHDLMPLATFFASDGDAVIVSEDMLSVCQDFYDRMKQPYHFISLKSGNKYVDDTGIVTPWGKDTRLAYILKKSGISINGMETDVLTTIRELASRKTAVQMLHSIMKDADNLPLCGESVYCSSVNEVEDSISDYGNSVLKAPLSSSGRGLRFAQDALDQPTRNWCRNVIEMQGGVVVEPYFNKIQDFACEFTIESSGDIQFDGLSLFTTNDRCSYMGNIVASQQQLRQILSLNMDISVLDETVDKLKTHLHSIFAGKYMGPLGVDMMLCRMSDGEIRVHPCVEINVRYTMGMLSMQLLPLLAQGSVGQFTIQFETTEEGMQQYIRQLPEPQFNHEGLLSRGSLLLTPVIPITRFVAVLEVTNQN